MCRSILVPLDRSPAADPSACARDADRWARALIAFAHLDFRDSLTYAARQLHYL